MRDFGFEFNFIQNQTSKEWYPIFWSEKMPFKHLVLTCLLQYHKFQNTKTINNDVFVKSLKVGI